MKSDINILAYRIALQIARPKRMTARRIRLTARNQVADQLALQFGEWGPFIGWRTAGALLIGGGIGHRIRVEEFHRVAGKSQ
jgi:hypothetical protein